MRRETRLMHYGRPTLPGPANPPVMRASTILHETVASYRDTKARRETDDAVLSYGRRGTTTAHALATALCDLEQGEACFLFPSGVAALVGALSAHLRSGDHLLVVDTVFPATRVYCEGQLRCAGVAIDYFPWDTTDLTPWIKPNTRAVFVESPGSQTFEVMDLPKLCESAHAKGLVVIADNTYGSGWLYRPLDLGCDVSVVSGTKYLSGHADVMMGAAVAKGAPTDDLRRLARTTGQLLAPDEAYACLKGMRTLALRLERHGENALSLARWFQGRPGVDEVLHPALPGHPGADIWTRDATGSNGLLTVVFERDFAVDAFLDRLTLFSIGSSWGGFESLAMPAAPDDDRRFPNAKRSGQTVRFHAGLEHVDDLTDDLNSAWPS